MTFPEKAIQRRQPQRSTPYNTPNPNPPQRPQHQNQPICLDWNDSPNGCSRASCHYNIYATVVSTTLELRTSTTKLPSVRTSRRTGITITSHNSYSSQLADSFFSFLYVHYCIYVYVQTALLQIQGLCIHVFLV